MSSSENKNSESFTLEQESNITEGLKDFNLKDSNNDSNEQEKGGMEMLLRLMKEQNANQQALIQALIAQGNNLAQQLNLSSIPTIRIRKITGKENPETVEKFIQQVTSEGIMRAFSEPETIKLAEYNLIEEAGKWKEENQTKDWTNFAEFAEALKNKCNRVAQESTTYLDLLILHQTSYLSKYAEQFEELKSKVDRDYTTDTFFKDKFILGLQEPLRTFVRLQNPPTWQIAKDWALAEDAKNRKLQSVKTHTTYNPNNSKFTNGNKSNNLLYNRTNGTKKV